LTWFDSWLTGRGVKVLIATDELSMKGVACMAGGREVACGAQADIRRLNIITRIKNVAGDCFPKVAMTLIALPGIAP
jgi:hypothetical protein